MYLVNLRKQKNPSVKSVMMMKSNLHRFALFSGLLNVSLDRVLTFFWLWLPRVASSHAVVQGILHHSWEGGIRPTLLTCCLNSTWSRIDRFIDSVETGRTFNSMTGE